MDNLPLPEERSERK